MNAPANYVAIPFFDRVPARAKAIVRRTCDLIDAPHASAALTHKIMCTDLAAMGIEPPTLDEFGVWFEEVRLGRFSRASYEDRLPARADMPPHLEVCKAQRQAWQQSIKQEQSLQLDRAIIRAAHSLCEAKLKAGYSPLSCGSEDSIVAEAIRHLLDAEVENSRDSIAYTDPVDVALAYLAGGGSDQDGKLLDILTMDMQQELCRELVRTGVAAERTSCDKSEAFHA